MSATRQQLASYPGDRMPTGRRSPMAHLLHALNQPLTGLQCSLELAVAGPRPQDQYVRTLREGLELACRMRVLVEAMRELADAPQTLVEEDACLRLDELVGEIVEDFGPVAATRKMRVKVEGTTALPVCAGRCRVRELLFRILDSVLSLAREASDLEISGRRIEDRCALVLSWCAASSPPAYSPFSAPELGLLVAQAGWEQLGGQWNHAQSEALQVLTLFLPLAESPAAAFPSSSADARLGRITSGPAERGDGR